MNIIRATAYYFLTIVEWGVIIRCLLSWIPIGSNSFTEVIYNLTEPLLKPIRNVMSRIPGINTLPLDFSPIVAIVILDMLVMWI